MARKQDRERKRAPKESTRRGKPKVCTFCKEHIDWVDYKDVNLLRRYMSDRGKIRTRRVSGCCTQHQREVAVAIKTARELALLPYTQRTVSERGGPRGRSGGSRGGDGYQPRPTEGPERPLPADAEVVVGEPDDLEPDLEAGATPGSDGDAQAEGVEMVGDGGDIAAGAEAAVTDVGAPPDES